MEKYPLASFLLVITIFSGEKMKKINKKLLSFDKTEISLNIFDFENEKWLFIVHGVGEHSQRHYYLIDLLGRFYNFCFFDLRGHGESKGRRAYINHFAHYTADLEMVIESTIRDFQVKEFALHGHSMGALIAINYLSKETTMSPRKVLLSSPPVGIKSYLGEKLKQHPHFTSLMADLPLSVPIRGTIDLKRLSHDIKVYEDYITDKLNSLGIHTRLLLSIADSANQIFEHPIPYKGDLAFVIGSNDGIVDVNDFENYLDKFGKNIKKLIVEGAYHELHNEIDDYKQPYLNFLKDFYQV